MRAALDAIVSHQPASRTYQLMTAVLYYGGLRPSEVVMLRAWLTTGKYEPDQLLFRTLTGRRPTASNWSRAWHRVLDEIGQPRLRLYDCRHAAATTWLSAGVPLGETARRLGHSVEVLVSTYVGALTGDEATANKSIDTVIYPDITSA